MCSVMGSDQQQFCLRWHNYQSSLLASLPQFLDGDDLTDVTLSAGGRTLRAHRVVLSACSQYFRDIFKELQPFQHPVVVLPGMNFRDLCALVTFMYSGEVNIYQEQLPSLLCMADTLHIRGLAETNGTSEKNSDVSATKYQSSAAKRPKVNANTSPNHFFNNSTNEESMFKSPHLQTEPKNFKDLNENTTNKSAEYDVLKNLSCGFNPFDDSTLKMMSNSSKGAKVSSKGKQKKNASPFKQVDPTVFQNPFPLPAKDPAMFDMLYRMLPYNKKQEGFKFPGDTAELNEAQDLTKIRIKTETDGNSESAETEGMDDSDHLTPTANVAVEMKPEMQSPSSDDSGGGNSASDSYRDSSGLCKALTSPAAQTKVFSTCYICGKQLSNQYNLRVHLETHQNVQYACGVCTHVSRSRDALRKHVSYRHPSEGKEGVSKRAKGEGGKRAKAEESSSQAQPAPQVGQGQSSDSNALESFLPQ